MMNTYIQNNRYNTDLFLIKNNDSVNEDLIGLVKTSSVSFVEELMQQRERDSGTKEDGQGPQKARVKMTVGSNFVEQLNNLKPGKRDAYLPVVRDV